MEIGEVLLHLLGGTGMEYAARSRFKQQAKEQGEQNRLSRMQERLLMGREHEYGGTQGALGRKSTEKIETERNIVTTGEGEKGRDLTEKLSDRDRASAEKIEKMRDATNRFTAELGANTQVYVENSRSATSRHATDTGAEVERHGIDTRAKESRHATDTGAKVDTYGIDTRAERDRIRGRQESILALTQIDATLAASVAEIGGEGVKALMDKNKYTLFTILQEDDPTLTLEDFEEMYQYVTASWEGAEIGPTEDKDEQDLRFMFREEYMAKTAAMPPNESEYREHMWVNLYILSEIQGYPETMRMASQAYEKQFGRPLTDAIKEIADGEVRVAEDKDSPGFFERRGAIASGISPLAFPFAIAMAGSNALMGYGDKSKEYLQIFEALAYGHTPATFLAAASRSRREGGKRSTMQILQEDYVPWMGTTTEKRKESLANPPNTGSSVTGAPDLLLRGE